MLLGYNILMPECSSHFAGYMRCLFKIKKFFSMTYYSI